MTEFYHLSTAQNYLTEITKRMDFKHCKINYNTSHFAN